MLLLRWVKPRSEVRAVRVHVRTAMPIPARMPARIRAGPKGRRRTVRGVACAAGVCAGALFDVLTWTSAMSWAV
ncbi:hypothetical protein [Streptomyces sp. NPDC000410]|uniref:hypothetical protein n=1 Tax=Streptomyces sp. NPDC000410 TaxID=3154254 RepID=UPI00333340CD